MPFALLLSVFGLLSSISSSARVVQLQSLTPQTTLRIRQPFQNFLNFNRRPIEQRTFGRKCVAKAHQRTYSGYCNNQLNPLWGASKTKFLHKSTHIVHNVKALPNARVISNAVCRETSSVPNKRGMSELVTFFGQFLDHTVTETENTDISWPITIPDDDPVFTNGGTIPFFRTRSEGAGVNASPVNSLSSYIDAASVYGSDEDVAKSLRSLSHGKMKLSEDDLLTTNSKGFYLSGDARANENPILTSLHTIFTREHNRVASEILAAFPKLTDEEVYQLARAVVGAEMQAVVYYEFLPAVLGRGLKAYKGYKSYVRGSISSEFSTVGFRVGHTMINAGVTSISKSGKTRTRMLRNSFFNPDAFLEDGVDALLRGIMRTKAAEVDAGITEEVRDFLVNSGTDRMMKLDLAALNIQRGRDHAVPSYNTLRSMYRLMPVRSFTQITSNKVLQQKLESVYGDVSKIDAWVGGISEDHTTGSLGPLFAQIWEDEFTRLRDGDRFYFENKGIFSEDQIAKIPTLHGLLRTKNDIGKVMRKVILSNTGLTDAEVEKNPFFV